MKKILTLVFLSAILTACSSSNQPSEPVTLTKNPALQQALQTCHQTLGDQVTHEAFKQCMQQQGFDKPQSNNETELTKSDCQCKKKQKSSSPKKTKKDKKKFLSMKKVK